jgi:hypothetical protein
MKSILSDLGARTELFFNDNQGDMARASSKSKISSPSSSSIFEILATGEGWKQRSGELAIIIGRHGLFALQPPRASSFRG